jgi:hypothetical protein
MSRDLAICGRLADNGTVRFPVKPLLVGPSSRCVPSRTRLLVASRPRANNDGLAAVGGGVDLNYWRGGRPSKGGDTVGNEMERLTFSREDRLSRAAID